MDDTAIGDLMSIVGRADRTQFRNQILRPLLRAEPPVPRRRRMTEAPIKLPPGHAIPIRSNSELAQLFDQGDLTHLNDVYRGRECPLSPVGSAALHLLTNLLDPRFPTFLVGAGPLLHGFWIVKNRAVCRVEREHALRFPGDVR
jgi:hypothetical protein